MRNMKRMDFKIMARECLQFVGEIIGKHGPRLAGTDACRACAQDVRERMEASCDAVLMEGFDFNRGAFTGFMKILAVGYSVITTCAFLGGALLPVAMIAYVVCTLSAGGGFVFYKRIFDPLYKKARGWNVSGVIQPSGEVRRQAVIAGHHDSANVFNFMVHFQKWYSIRIMAGLVWVFVPGFLVFVWGARYIAGFPDPGFVTALRAVLAAGLVAVLPFYFFINRAAVPGAGDNLIATAILCRLADVFGTAKRKGRPLLSSTRLVFLSTDAEEEGLRGARAYVKAHRDELLAVPTRVINIDSLYALGDLRCLTSEINGFLKTSGPLAEDCRRIAAALGYELPAVPIAFGGGSTDAAEFARIGVEATCILGLSTHYIREGMVYHTMNDTVDRIEPDIVEAVLKIVYHYILELDAVPDVQSRHGRA